MKPLLTEFQSGGFHFRQLWREGDLILLEKTKPHWTEPSYEVCIVRKCADRTIAGKFIPASEALPSSESWGTYGWTYRSREKAKAKFCRLVESRTPQGSPLLSTATPKRASEIAGSVSVADATVSPHHRNAVEASSGSI
jgi:hypothetical protein